VHEFAIDARRDALRVGADLRHTIAAKPGQRAAGRNVRLERELARVHRLPRRGARQRVASFSFARLSHRHRQIRGQGQRELVQLARFALHQFDLDLGQRRAPASGTDLASVEAKHRARAIGKGQRLRGAVDLGHEHRAQPPGGRFEHAAPGCGG
jgi:hypothetical protein